MKVFVFQNLAWSIALKLSFDKRIGVSIAILDFTQLGQVNSISKNDFKFFNSQN